MVWTLIDNGKLANHIARLAAIVVKSAIEQTVLVAVGNIGLIFDLVKDLENCFSAGNGSFLFDEIPLFFLIFLIFVVIVIMFELLARYLYGLCRPNMM